MAGVLVLRPCGTVEHLEGVDETALHDLLQVRQTSSSPPSRPRARAGLPDRRRCSRATCPRPVHASCLEARRTTPAAVLVVC